MNMMLRKPEIYAPSFPDLELNDEFEVKDDQVLFSLEVSGTITPIYVAGFITGAIKTDCFEYNNTVDPQNAVDIDYEYIELDCNTLATVADVSEVSAFAGMSFKLTPKQAEKLNEWLKAYGEESKQAELQAN
ncbi:hypothetical protein [Acinetobacter soli]|uniref:hypothetical protein n=1 Tax=Acinetobacter soli TaxID=487316 RepID=UPI001D0B2F58|nr:hypothetical protein [Acinetobacter soli]MCB8770142.1 hypothetical protein [Acinetobacter soli]